MRCSPNAPLLEARNGSFAYVPGHRVFEDVTIELAAGDVLTILGPNGSGKSTLLDCLSGLTPRPVDWVSIEGRRIKSLSPRERARCIGYVFQMQQVSFDFSAFDYLLMGRASSLALLGRPATKDFAFVRDVLERLEIPHLADKRLSKMSGGERQQVQIARALVQEPKILLFDEPTNHLDFGNQLKVLRIIKSLAKSGTMAVVMTTHVPDHAILLGGKVAILDRSGRIKVGEVNDVVTEDALGRLYGANVRMVYVDAVGREVCMAEGL